MGEAITYGDSSGLVKNYQFSLNRDKKGLWTGSQKFHCLRAELAASIPSNGTVHPDYDWVYAEGVDVTGMEGDWAEFNVKYAGADPGGGGDGGGGGGGGGGNDADDPDAFEQGLRISTSEQPLATNLKYKDLTPQEKQDAVMAATQPAKNKSGEVKPVDTSDWSDDKKDLYDRMRKGLVAYLEPGVEFFQRYVSKKMPSRLNDIGKISDPKGAPAVGDRRNWLLVGYNITERSTGKNSTYDIEKVWVLSGRGGWDEDIYRDAAD